MVGRPKNGKRFSGPANAERRFRRNFGALRQAFVDWDSGVGSFDSVMAAIDEIERDCGPMPGWECMEKQSEGATNFSYLASRFKQLSIAHASLLQVTGQLASMRDATRDQMTLAAATLGTRPDTLPFYMAQLTTVIRAAGITKRHVMNPTLEMGNRIANAIKSGTKSGAKKAVNPPQKALIDHAASTQSQLPPQQPLRRHTLSAPLSKEERMQLWSDLPRKHADFEWDEIPNKGRVPFPLPPFRTIEEFEVDGLYPKLGKDRSATYLSYAEHLELNKSYWEPELNEFYAIRWAILLASHLPADHCEVKFWFSGLVQSPWNEDCGILLNLRYHRS